MLECVGRVDAGMMRVELTEVVVVVPVPVPVDDAIVAIFVAAGAVYRFRRAPPRPE